MASDSTASYPSPNKRLKILTLSPNQHQSSLQNSSMDSCGICLSDNGKAIRGRIDSCDHYFCFVCIMEWAKIESKCPLCKRRFSTIFRPQKNGVFPCERVVNVPIRDQVFHFHGNVTSGPFDPYSQVQCSLCHGGADESLLLLCDLCDSAAHTYCVGLGATVPEGDWFCHDCTLSKAEHSSCEIDTDCDNQTAKAHVSLSNTVQNWFQGPGRVFSDPNTSSSPVGDGTVIRIANVPRQAPRPLRDVADKGTESTARTLHRCRNVHNHIRALRENWDALRNGSLRFSSSSIESDAKSNKERNIGAVLHLRSGRPSTSSSTSSQQSITRNGFPGDPAHNRGCDIDKAWKMLDIIKVKEQAREGTNSSQKAPKEPFSKRNASRESSAFLVSKSLVLRTSDLRRTEMEKTNRVTTDRSPESSKDFPATRSPGFPSSRKIKTSTPGDDVYSENRPRLSQKNIHGTSSNDTIHQNGSSGLISLVMSLPGPFDAKPEVGTLSSSKVDIPEERVMSGNGYAESNKKKVSDAKSEIQSLVKLNLKLLRGHKQLGADSFKEVAWLATHSILAACDLEHTKAGVRSFPSFVCSHTEHDRQLHKSTLMPNSCRECFYIFVKDVVNSIMLEKVGCAKSC